MGAYGSPDLSKKYVNAEEYKVHKNKKRIVIGTQTIVLILLYLTLILNNDNKLVMTASFLGIMSMVYFVINSIMMVVKLIKKQSVNKEVIKLLICIVIFVISGILI